MVFLVIGETTANVPEPEREMPNHSVDSDTLTACTEWHIPTLQAVRFGASDYSRYRGDGKTLVKEFECRANAARCSRHTGFLSAENINLRLECAFFRLAGRVTPALPANKQASNQPPDEHRAQRPHITIQGVMPAEVDRADHDHNGIKGQRYSRLS